MKEQLKTIRELFDSISVPYETLIAFERLESMVGAQEPVAYAIFAENGNIRLWSTESQHVKRIAQEKGLSLVPLYATPVAQQPQEIEVQCPVCNHKFYEWPNDKQPQAEAVPPTNLIDPAPWSVLPLLPRCRRETFRTSKNNSFCRPVPDREQ